MQSKDKDPVVAIACADLHLSHLPPIARAGEPDWYAAMARPLNEIKKLANQYSVPVLCAGDIFHHWKAPPELINFAIDCLPYMIAIPGQHDLPLHSYADINKSAYATLVKADKIGNCQPGQPYLIHALAVHGFPWGVPVKASASLGRINIALHHAYRCSAPNTSYAGAPAEAQINAGEYQPFHVVVIGDNHISFTMQGVPTIFNCGSLMRRNGDQQSHQPRVGLIRMSGHVESHYLDTSRDVLAQVMGERIVVNAVLKLDDLLNEIYSLQAATLDYPEVLRQVMESEKVPPLVRQLLLEALTDGHRK